jgi:peroxin-6
MPHHPRPCVVFFDELDSLAPNRGGTGDSGGVMDRIVSQLLAELDGLHTGNDVFIIGATNRPDLIDPGLLRPGRLDRLIYLSAPSKEDQRRIFTALTRKYDMDPAFDAETVLERCNATFTGADMYALASDAMLNAIRRSIDAIDAARAAAALDTSEQLPPIGAGAASGGDAISATAPTNAPSKVLVTTGDFLEALANLTPSVTPEQIAHYTSLHAQFSPDN